MSGAETMRVARWRFALADHSEAWAKGFDDSTWREVIVPHDWSVEQDFSPEHSSGTGYLPGGIGWYRAHVSLSALERIDGSRILLSFGAVYKNADVWVNGYHFGGRPNGHVPFSFDLTEVVSYAPDDDLVISVRVDRTEIADSRWYNGSGITRAVVLEVHGPLRVAAQSTAFTATGVTGRSAVIRIAQTVVSDLGQAADVRVRHELHSLSSGDEHVFERDLEIPAGASLELAVEGRVPHPQLWSDAEPSLYRLTTIVTWRTTDGQGRIDRSDVVGIRSVVFDPDRGLLVNGEPRTLKGVCLHEDAGCLGVAVPAQVWLRRLLALKDMGCNAVRMAHNPHDPVLYALCDALGFFVIDEAFDEWESPKNKWWHGHNVYPPKHEGYATHFPLWHERDLRDMIAAHRNHPSIIAWSIGNEIDYPNDPYASELFEEMTGNNDANKPAQERVYDPSRPDVRRLTTIARRLGEIVRDADPSRPVTFAAAFPELSSRTGLLDDLDVVGYNYKEHLYAEDHARFPGKPFVGSENGHGYAEWRAVVDNAFIAGQFLWTGIDYLGEAHGWPVHGSGAGLLTLAGFPKHEWHLRRSWWSDQPTAHLAVRAHEPDADRKAFWRHPVSRQWAAGDGVIEVLAFVGGGRPRLSIDGADVPLEFDEDGGYWGAVASASAAVLRLEVADAGRVVATDELRPAGDPVRLAAALWRAPEDAARRCRAAGIDIDDVVQIECALLDRDGAVAAAEASVAVEVHGGRLLGLENGDLADVTAYRSLERRTRDGRLIAYVREGEQTSVRISGTGIEAVTVQL
ncbi:glycoside hydrolase family 2 TIM barrel-domain containing protein [Microbacterium sp. NPDC056234]|uniref:glycoside hydrolase family 2 TIM barrel-domain containing protein n=1 Tax=Microbacterium sp. NPDC056234 TaxID=3345757 RepID=UPI0035DCB0EC